jgi:hypothetical protein
MIASQQWVFLVCNVNKKTTGKAARNVVTFAKFLLDDPGLVL